MFFVALEGAEWSIGIAFACRVMGRRDIESRLGIGWQFSMNKIMFFCFFHKPLPFFSKINVIIKILHNLALF
jgi:hypothetical protein